MSLPEIFATVEALSENDWSDKRFTASLQGVDLDGAVGGPGEEQETEKEVMDRIVAKANAILSGANPDDEASIETQRFAQYGIDYEQM